jgi:integrase
LPKISKRVVDAAQPTADGKRYTLWDDTLKGFGLLVLPSGVKSFVFDYRNGEGRKRRATIGKVGSVTPHAARQSAENMADRVRTGGDPLDDKSAGRLAPTMARVFDAYLASARFAEKAESTRSIDQGRIKRHLRPLLDKSHPHKLKPEDVRRTFNAIKSGKTAIDQKTGAHGRAIVRGGEGTARAAIRLLRAILSWAVSEGLVDRNPALGVAIGSDGERETILEGPEQYSALFKTLAKLQAEKRIRGPVADVVRVLALTGARRSEISGARWRHVDLEAGTIVLPPTAHKTGRRTGKPRVINLPAAAVEIVARQKKGAIGAYVFLPAKGTGPMNLDKPWRLIRTEAGLPEGIGLHGLRHSLATSLAVGGAQASEIMTALGHRDISTSARYVHFAEKARSTLAERAAATVLEGMAAASDVIGNGDK